MRVLVVGAGMYVTGDGGLGTILGGLAEHHRAHGDLEVLVTARRDASETVTRSRADLEKHLGIDLPLRFELAGDLMPTIETRRLDAAIVSVPDHAHHDVTLPLLEAGIHCLVVKPLAPSLREAKALVEAATRNATYGAVELHKRYDQANRLTKRMFEDGSLGPLSYAEVAFSQRRSIVTDTFRDWATTSNPFQYLGVHYVDLVHHITGYRPRRATAIGTKGIAASEGVDVVDSVHAIVEWERPDGGTFVSQLGCNWMDPTGTAAMSEQRITWVGAHGRIDADQKRRGFVLSTADQTAEVNPYFSQVVSDHDGAHRFEGYGPTCIRRFLDDAEALVEGTITPEGFEGRRPTFRDALPGTAVVEAVNASLARDGAWQPVDT